MVHFSLCHNFHKSSVWLYVLNTHNIDKIGKCNRNITSNNSNGPFKGFEDVKVSPKRRQFLKELLNPIIKLYDYRKNFRWNLFYCYVFNCASKKVRFALLRDTNRFDLPLYFDYAVLFLASIKN